MKTRISLFTLLFAAVLLHSAAASDALGETVRTQTTPLQQGTELTETAFRSENGDLRQERYVAYTPNAAVTPIVTFGSYVTDRTSVSAAAKALEARGYRVAAGINGDYYGVSTGMPTGSVMSEGILRNTTDENYAIGFRADGTAILGSPKLTLTARASNGAEFPIAALNSIRYSYGGIFLYSQELNARGTIATTEPGVDVICSCVTGTLAIDDKLVLCVEQVLPNAVDTPTAAGKYILSANLLAGKTYTAPLLALKPGMYITVSLTAEDHAWDDVRNIVGALYPLLENGQVCSGLPTGAAPRTAIGQRADGSLIFYTIDGRQDGYSVGASLTQVAQRLSELGCVTALSLDGGGSTTLVGTLPQSETAAVLNRPSDGTPRAVTNHVFLVSSRRATGILDRVLLRTSAQKALPGAEVAVEAVALDSAFYPVASRVSFRTSGGTLSGSTLTLPQTPGVVTVRAQCGVRSAEAAVEVLSSPEEILLRTADGASVSALTLTAGETLALTAEARADRVPIPSVPENFRWEVRGDCAVLNGQTLEARKGGSGELVLTAGETVRRIPLTVLPAAPDTAAPQLRASLSDGLLTASVSDETDGTALSALSVSFDGAAIPYSYDPASGTLTAALSAADGALHRVTLTAQDSSGNRARLSLDLPATDDSPAFSDTAGHWANAYIAYLRRSGVSNGNGDGCYLPEDNISRQEFAVLLSRWLAPAEDASAEPLPFADADEIAPWALSGVRAMTALGVLRGSERDGALYCDPTGSISRAEAVTMLSRLLDAGYPAGTLSFADADDIPSWSRDAAARLSALGILSGYPDGAFHPNDAMSRAQVAVVLYRML